MQKIIAQKCVLLDFGSHKRDLLIYWLFHNTSKYTPIIFNDIVNLKISINFLKQFLLPADLLDGK